MKFRKSLVSVLAVASLGIMSVPTTAAADVGIYFNSPPPAVRYEAVPAPRHGYTWSSGYWNAKGQRHVWQAGHWEKDRSGHYLTQPSWTQHDNRWQLARGHWHKGDRDHDGFANAIDSAHDNPNRR